MVLDHDAEECGDDQLAGTLKVLETNICHEADGVPLRSHGCPAPQGEAVSIKDGGPNGRDEGNAFVVRSRASRDEEP